MRRAALTPTLILLAVVAGPLQAQGPLGPAKAGKSRTGEPAQTLEELVDWARAGRFVIEEGPLIAVLHESLKAMGIRRFPPDARLAVKAALRAAEEGIRSAVDARAAGELTGAQASEHVRTAVEAYAAELESFARPPS